MSWRTVVISRRCKLDLCMNYLEIRADDLKKIHLSEIHTIIIESTDVSLTASLLCELILRKIKVIFCDEKRNPCSELIPYYGSHDSSAHIRQQISWDESIKGMVWAKIVAEKIRRQQELLVECGKTEKAALLGVYVDDVVEADASNREGHAARVYFTGLFGPEFNRSMDNAINAALNYGYSLLLSAFNKEIAASGYLTQIGIFHDNMFNPFNLASDFMEPFRPLVDRLVWELKPVKFDKEEKIEILNILNQKVMIDHQVHFVSNAIKIYTHSIFDALNDKKTDEIVFYLPYREKKKTKRAERYDRVGGDESQLQQKVLGLLHDKQCMESDS